MKSRARAGLVTIIGLVLIAPLANGCATMLEPPHHAKALPVPPGFSIERPEWKGGYEWVYDVVTWNPATGLLRMYPLMLRIAGEGDFDGTPSWVVSEGGAGSDHFVVYDPLSRLVRPWTEAHKLYFTKDTLSFRGRATPYGQVLQGADPDAGTYRWPLEVGKRWSDSWTTKDGKR